MGWRSSHPHVGYRLDWGDLGVNTTCVVAFADSRDAFAVGGPEDVQQAAREVKTAARTLLSKLVTNGLLPADTVIAEPVVAPRVRDTREVPGFEIPADLRPGQ